MTSFAAVLVALLTIFADVLVAYLNIFPAVLVANWTIFAAVLVAYLTISVDVLVAYLTIFAAFAASANLTELYIQPNPDEAMLVLHKSVFDYDILLLVELAHGIRTSFLEEVLVAQLVVSISGVVLGGYVEVVSSNLARGKKHMFKLMRKKIFTILR